MVRDPQADGAAPKFGPDNPPPGRKKGSKNKATLFREQVEQWKARKARGEKMMTPLDFFEMTLNDPTASKSRKMQAAALAAPYQHHRLPQRAPDQDPTEAAKMIRELLKKMRETSNA